MGSLIDLSRVWDVTLERYSDLIHRRQRPANEAASFLLQIEEEEEEEEEEGEEELRNCWRRLEATQEDVEKKGRWAMMRMLGRRKH